jgi:hypothetical protein
MDHESNDTYLKKWTEVELGRKAFSQNVEHAIVRRQNNGENLFRLRKMRLG